MACPPLPSAFLSAPPACLRPASGDVRPVLPASVMRMPATARMKTKAGAFVRKWHPEIAVQPSDVAGPRRDGAGCERRAAVAGCMLHDRRRAAGRSSRRAPCRPTGVWRCRVEGAACSGSSAGLIRPRGQGRVALRNKAEKHAGIADGLAPRHQLPQKALPECRVRPQDGARRESFLRRLVDVGRERARHVTAPRRCDAPLAYG